MELSIEEEQERFIASNVWSLVHAYVGNKTSGAVYPFGIYDDDTPVGFLMLAYDYGEVCDDKNAPEISKNNYFFWRLMIDKRWQGKGYGRQAFQMTLDFIRTYPCGPSDLCWLSYEPENEAAKKLYASFGFVEDPDNYKEGEEMPAILKL